MAREVGPLRFEPHLPDSAVLTKCLEWKALQYRRARLPNWFAFDWVVDLFERLLSLRSDSFSSMISVLYAGDQMVSIILSLRYRDVLHAWFPAYDRQFAHYSPGTLLWFEMMRASQQLGIRRIELGKGPEKFKRRFMSGATRVAEGAVDPRPVTAAMRNAWQKTRSWIQSSSFNAPARAPAQLIYRCRSWIEYH
jgi:CelD/BcsL family acetyltransferase involved in cellulose biosynthesis